MANEWWGSDPNQFASSSNPYGLDQATIDAISKLNLGNLGQNALSGLGGTPYIDSSRTYPTYDQYIAGHPYQGEGDLWDGLTSAFKAGLGQIASDPSRLFTGIDPLSTGISNAVLGQNKAPITDAFGTPSNTTWEQAQAKNPNVDFTDAHSFAQLSDAALGIGAGAGIGGAVAGAANGAANTIAGGGGALLGDAAPLSSSLAAAAAPAASVAGALPAIVVNGAGGSLAGLSAGAGIAGGVGAGIVNGQINPNQPTLGAVNVTGSNVPNYLQTAGALGGAGAPVLDAVNVNGQKPPAQSNDTNYLGSLAGLGSGLSNLSSPAGGTASSGSGSNGMDFNWTDLIGPLLKLGGGLVGQNAANQGSEAAIRLAQQGSYPYNVNIPGYGQSTFDPANRTASLNPDGSLANFQQQGNNLSQQGYNGLTGLLGNPYGQSGYGGTSPQLQQQFGQTQNSQYRNPTSNVFGSPQVFSGLLSQSGQTAQNLYGQVGQGLPSTSGANSYLNAGQGFLNNATGFNLPGQEATNLQRLRSQAQFGESQAQQNNLENQFGRGVLASTAGGYQTQGLNQALQTADVQRQALAHQMAMGDQSQMLQNSVGASNAGYGYLQGIQGLQGGQLNQANQALGGYQNLQQTGYGQSFANNSYGNDTTNQAFQQAMSLFGAGMNSNQQQFGQQNQAYNQGQANSLNIGGYLQGLLGLGGNLGALSSGASGTAAGIAANQGVNNGNLYAGLFNNLGSSVNWGSLFGSNTSATPK